MIEQNFTLNTNIILDFGGLKFNPEIPGMNIISLNKIDYFPNFLDPQKPGNKGSNLLLKLFEAQNWDDEVGYPETSELVIKICKIPIHFNEKPRSMRFNDELVALNDCAKIDPLNTINVYNFGILTIRNKDGRSTKHRYYTMDYASDDLATYLKKKNLSLLERIDLFLEICDSLRVLWKADYYHRDIKPDNILFVNGKWKIADLGLVEHRYDSFGVDEKGEWIGPRGWQSPESLNKFLTEDTPWGYKFNLKIDHQSDLYQLGKLLWYITQGNCPEGGIDRNDFLYHDDRLYQVVKTLLNNNKNRRLKNIDELIKQVKRIYDVYYLSNPIFSLH
jgi:serine/threonine protein kinase